MSNMGKGAGYYLTRSKSLLIDTAIVAILAIFMSFAMQMDTLQSKGDDYLVLMLYAVIFGLTSLQSGAMIVDLTAKDKLSRRIEFFAASGKINLFDTISKAFFKRTKLYFLRSTKLGNFSS